MGQSPVDRVVAFFKWLTRWISENLAWGWLVSVVSSPIKGGAVSGIIMFFWAAWSSAPLFIKFVGVIGAAALIAWFLVAVTRLIDWSKSRKQSRNESKPPQTEDEPRRVSAIRFSMPEDQSGLSHEVWYRIPIDVADGKPLERCETYLVAHPVKDGVSAIPLMWTTREGPRAEITLDPGKGWYYVPVVKRSESDEHGHAFFCDEQSYENKGVWPGNMPPPGHVASYQLWLRWSGGGAYSYPFEINVPHKGVTNGKFYIRPLISWKQK